MSILNTRLSPYLTKAVAAAQRLYERWETMTPEERERYVQILQGGAARARHRLPSAAGSPQEPRTPGGDSTPKPFTPVSANGRPDNE